MTAVVRGDALHIPLADNSVDLIVTSPPYFALRSYRDDGDHYDGQIGSEPTPQQFLEALWAVTRECHRVLKPSGSMFVNLGDKRSGSGGHNNSGIARQNSARWCEMCQAPVSRMTCTRCGGTNLRVQVTRRNAPDRYNQAAYGRPKSKMLLPHRYAIGCEDGQADPDGVGWIVRQDIVWNKPNGLPESVVDRVRDSHEYWFHLTKSERYYSAIDEIREAQSGSHAGRNGAAANPNVGTRTNEGVRAATFMGTTDPEQFNPLGKLPGSVWTIPSEPLTIPEWLGVDHFAAFPQEWPRRLILGWTPSGICIVCGEGRRPVVAKERTHTQKSYTGSRTAAGVGQVTNSGGDDWLPGIDHATITGYACACTPWRDHPGTGETSGPSYAEAVAAGSYVSPLANRPKVGPWREYLTDGWTPPPTRPAVVLDPFGGTGTVAMVARALGRTGISLDLSADYSRLAAWRIFHSGHAAKTRERTNRDRQGTML